MPYWIAALEAAAFPFFCTCAGAASVFLMGQGGSPVLQSAVDGFAGGVMLAASIFSLLLPAIEASTGPAWAACGGGMLLGAWLLLSLEKRAEELCGGEDRGRRLWLGITLHNLPEGMVVGLAAAGGQLGAAALALGIGLQNLPEGAAVSLPLYKAGRSRARAFGAGVLSGAVEPLGAVAAALAAGALAGALPWALSMAAGAMICVCVQELLPRCSGNAGLAGFFGGFALMMALDLAF